MPDVVVYRGQKAWNAGMDITAGSMRRAVGIDPTTWTDALIAMIDSLLERATSGDKSYAKLLEQQLLTAQGIGYQNPFVSCTHTEAAAGGFALAGDTPGYVLTITGPEGDGFDFEAVRARFNLYSDAFDYLEEFGLRRRLQSPFRLAEVKLIDGYSSTTVYTAP